MKTQTDTKKRNRNRPEKTCVSDVILKLSGPLLFGLKLLSVENMRMTLQLGRNPKIRPFEALGISTKCRKVLEIAEKAWNMVEEEKETIFHPDDHLKIKQIRFKIANKLVEVNFGKLDQKSEEERKKAIVKSLDHSRIAREAYRSLAQIEQDIPRETAISDMRQKILC